MHSPRHWTLATVLTAGLAAGTTVGLLPACGVSSSVDSEPALTLAVTDASSDDLAGFSVGLQSVRLLQAGGGVISLLPQPVAVDFAALEDLSRVLNVKHVPLGAYVGAEVTLDFTNASVYLLGQTSEATLLDGDGNLLDHPVVLPVTLAFNFQTGLNRNHTLELDLDLDQSVVVDQAANSVMVEPSVVLRIDRLDPKMLAIGGDLRDADLTQQTFRLGLPAPLGTAIPLVTVAIDSATVFQIDGVPYAGGAGLAQLAQQPLASWVQAFGAVDSSTALFRAHTVEAGRGSYNGGSDLIEGHVVARAGATGVLTVLGHSNDATHTAFQFNRTFTVNTSQASTKVVLRGSLSTLDTGDVNVGQLVRVFGSLSGQTMDATSDIDVIRLQPTRLLGYATAAPAGGQLTLDLARVDLRDAGDFMWSDGGPTPPDPHALVALTGNLGDSLGILQDTPVALTGFFTSVSTSGPDFFALTLENRALSNSLMAIHDRSGGMTVDATLTDNLITLALTGSPGLGELALIDRGFIGATPLPSSPSPKLVPLNPNFGLGYYTIRDRTLGTVVTYLRFSDFTAGLSTLQGQGAVLFNLGAVGQYDAPTNRLQTALIGVVIE